MTKEKSKKIIQILKKYYGHIETSLSFSSLYELAIAVVLSAQTTDKQVNTVAARLFNKFSDFTSLSKANIHTIESLIKSVGLYKTKARNIINLSKEVIDKYNNIVPGDFNELIKLPGIGRKSANVILSIGFNKPAFPVDTHILRIANRIGYIKTDDPYKVEQILMRYLPKSYWRTAHLLLIKHGRNICKARKPLCSDCPINKLCDFAKNL